VRNIYGGSITDQPRGFPVSSVSSLLCVSSYQHQSHELSYAVTFLKGRVIMHKDFPYVWCINKSPPFVLQST
jgi:hypothetical protein